MKVLTIVGRKLYAEHLGAILCVDAHDPTEVNLSINLPRQYPFEATELSRRFLRLGAHCLQEVDKGLVLVVKGKILRYDLEGKRLSHSFRTPSGNRSLFLCLDLNHDLYFSEYIGNEDRQPVHIYQSRDGGRSFVVVHTFPVKSVRHIHGIFHDPYTDTLWVTTGDTDAESGIWVTENGFRSLQKILGDSQQTRAVQLLFTRAHVYFGSDAPLEKNFIYRMERNSSRIEKLQEVESPVFWGCMVGEHLFFSTVVEPTSISPMKLAYLWGSKDGEHWKRITGFRKDIWPMRLFQYGQIQFPTGKNDTGYLFFTPFATEKHGTIQRLKVTDLF